MGRPASYSTRQQKAILSYIISLDEGHATAAQITGHFANAQAGISRTTVYRQLERMSQEGLLRKYAVNGVAGACYQYVANKEACSEHLHLKCESCGELRHLDCDMLEEIRAHLSDRHAFEVNNTRTVLYGKCKSCI